MASSTPYDDVFRTLLNDCSELIFPVLNEAFGEHYTGHERIEFGLNEHFISQGPGNHKKRITDSSFTVFSTVRKRYHIESQSTEERRMLMRIFEYDTQIALDKGEADGDTLTVTFPHSAVLYLRSSRKTPERMIIRMVVPGGEISYRVPVIQVRRYGLDDLFEKKLLFLLPFYLFNHEKRFPSYEEDETKLASLKSEYASLMTKLEKLQSAGELDEFTRRTIITMMRKVATPLAKNYQKVRKGVTSVMGGKILNYEAKTILNKGRAEGRAEGKLDVVVELLRAKQPLELIAKVSKFSVERIAEIGKAHGLVIQP